MPTPLCPHLSRSPPQAPPAPHTCAPMTNLLLPGPPQRPWVVQPGTVTGTAIPPLSCMATCRPAHSPLGTVAACAPWPSPIPSGVRFWLGLGPAQWPLPPSLQPSEWRPCSSAHPRPGRPFIRGHRLSASPQAPPPALGWGTGRGVGAGRGQGGFHASTAPSVCPRLCASPVHGPGLRLAAAAPSSPSVPKKHASSQLMEFHESPNLSLSHTHTRTQHTAFRPPQKVQLRPAARPPPKAWGRAEATC